MFEKKPEFVDLNDLISIADQINPINFKNKKKPVIESKINEEPIISSNPPLESVRSNFDQPSPSILPSPKKYVKTEQSAVSLENYLGSDIKWIQ
jgi:hypothetical protein